uniref:Tetraspanin n=1 Tax=Leersia perrieri TaxID=77586 RepID=A0A0D9VN65_9ORYZ
MALNNYVGVAGINLVAALLSIPVIAAGIWLSTQVDSACVQLLKWPLIGLGVAVLAVGVAGFVGAFWRLPWLLLAYLVGMLLLVVALACLAVFVFVVTAGGASSGHAVPSRAFLEYDLEDFSGWLRGRVADDGRWEQIKTCLAATPVCSDVNHTYGASAQDFFSAHITPLQSGCCKPPTRCGYTFVTPIFWISPISASADPDCASWTNDQSQLCYSCSSCKAALLQDLRKQWRRADLILLVATVLLLAVYAFGCFAFRTAKTDELFRRYRQGHT